MDKEFYTKYSNDLDCLYCSWITKCKDADEPVCVGGLLKHYKDQVKVLEKALNLAVAQLDDAKDMLRDAGKNDWAGLIDTSADYFKARAREELNNG